MRSPSKTFPGRVRGTADPSTTLGMTKGTAALSFGPDTVDDEQQVPPLRSPEFPVEQEIRGSFGRDDTSVGNGQSEVGLELGGLVHGAFEPVVGDVDVAEGGQDEGVVYADVVRQCAFGYRDDGPADDCLHHEAGTLCCERSQPLNT